MKRVALQTSKFNVTVKFLNLSVVILIISFFDAAACSPVVL